MLTPQPFIDWLEKEMAKRNLTSQAETSRRAGLSVNAINQIMNGQRPGMRTCAALAKLFDVPLTEVLRLAGYPDAAMPPALGAAEEQAVLNFFRRMDDEGRRRALAVMKALVSDNFD